MIHLADVFGALVLTTAAVYLSVCAVLAAAHLCAMACGGARLACVVLERIRARRRPNGQVERGAASRRPRTPTG